MKSKITSVHINKWLQYVFTSYSIMDSRYKHSTAPVLSTGLSLKFPPYLHYTTRKIVWVILLNFSSKFGHMDKLEIA